MRYPGGKNGAGVYQTIINEIPPHQVYIEPFLGSGAIMRFKKPAKWNIGIDINHQAISEFTCNHRAEIIQANALNWLTDRDGYPKTRKLYDGDEILIYLDPPYLPETRSNPNLYDDELTRDDHFMLLDIITALDCRVMISGYPSALYETQLIGWTIKTYQTMTRGGPAIEALWYNYPEPEILHDYSFLGDNFTDRQRIKRKINRWTNKLNNLPARERNAILEALKPNHKA